MKVKFNDKIYKKNNRSGAALKDLCFTIFKQYLDEHPNMSYAQVENVFNQYHCNNNAVVLSKDDWNLKTDDLKNRYFSPVIYNGEELYFTTQWGNNGGDCDNINNMIHFAQDQRYDIEVLENDNNETSLTTEPNKGTKISMNAIKNIILYGPPGTGKTHNVNYLMSLIEQGKSQREIFDVTQSNTRHDIVDISYLKDRMKFVTFHQSFGYEDFIEGFRPNESGNIELADGIFKLLCEKARKNLIDSQKPQEELSKKESFKKVLEAFIDEVESELESKGIYLLTKNVYISDVEDDAFRYKGDNWTIHSSGIRMRFDVLEELYLEGVKSRQDVKKAYNIGGLAKQHATYFWRVMEKIYEVQSKQNIQTSAVEKVERKNYYLVIDEINRGNISKIFGELITLIEEDKRDTLEVTLPYSKKPFIIPSNLYIIGTMNSTDKSIALIDIALRRRFTFLKMKPNLELVEYVEAKRIMEQLNERITETLGADYVLGHSYFMQIQNDDDLGFVLEYKIKPLLEEYFYGDKEGLNEVLGVINE